MNVNRRRVGTFLAGAVGSFAAGPKAAARRSQAPAPLARAAARLPAASVTKIRVFYPPNYNANGPQAFPQSNMVVLVDTDAGITATPLVPYRLAVRRRGSGDRDGRHPADDGYIP